MEAMVHVPIHMCIVVGMLLVSPIYVCAADNLPLKEEVQAKQGEINDFAEQNEQAAGQYEVPSPLSDVAHQRVSLARTKKWQTRRSQKTQRS